MTTFIFNMAFGAAIVGGNIGAAVGFFVSGCLAALIFP